MADETVGSPGIRLPRSFLEEIERELARAQNDLGIQHQRVKQLQALYRMSLALEARLDKEVTVVDLITTADGPDELARRQRLVEVLRPSTVTRVLE